MSPAELRTRWQSRLEEWRRLGVSVNGEAVAREILADVEQLELTGSQEALTLDEAAHASGYSIDHLRHLIAGGQLTNAGRKHAPRVRRADLPRKPSAVRAAGRATAGYDADADAIRLVSGDSRQ